MELHTKLLLRLVVAGSLQGCMHAMHKRSAAFGSAVCNKVLIEKRARVLSFNTALPQADLAAD